MVDTIPLLDMRGPPFSERRPATLHWGSRFLPFGSPYGTEENETPCVTCSLYTSTFTAMPNYIYTDKNGQKQGPVSEQQLQELVTRGTITPETLIQSTSGHFGKAGRIPGLSFAKSPPPLAVPTQNVNVLRSGLVAAIVGIVLLLSIGVATMFLFGKDPRVDALKEFLNKTVFADVPMQISGISVKWTKNGGTTTGNFTVTAKTTEKLYKEVDDSTGLQTLGITKNFSREWGSALDKFHRLPSSYQDNLRTSLPQNFLRFYSLLVNEGDEVTKVVTAVLTKHGNDWTVDKPEQWPFSCGNVFTQESKLVVGEYKLDDPQTKDDIEAIIRDQESFVIKVNAAWQEWQFTDLLKNALNTNIFSSMPLEIADIAVQWTQTDDSAIGKFTVTAKTTEKLYKLVSDATGLQTLGITNHYTEEYNKAVDKLPMAYQDGLRRQFWRFYNLLEPKGEEVTLTGSVNLTQSMGNWRVGQLLPNSFSCGDDFTMESHIVAGEYKLDDPKTKGAIETIIEQKKDFVAKVDTAIQTQIDNFRECCKPGTKYTGRFALPEQQTIVYDVSVTFKESVASDSNKADGVISISYQGRWSIDRPLSVSVDTVKLAEYPVSGSINNNNLLRFDDFVKLVKAPPDGRADAKVFHDFLQGANGIDIQFTDKVVFSLTSSRASNCIDIPLLRDGSGRPVLKHIVMPTPPAAPGASPAPMSVLQQTAAGIGVSGLYDEIKKAGFSEVYSPVKSFVQYGNIALRDQLFAAVIHYDKVDPFDKANAKKRIDAAKAEISKVQADIVKKQFQVAYSYSAPAYQVKVHGDQSSARIEIDTGIRTPQAQGSVVSFPARGVTAELVEATRRYDRSGCIRIVINGKTADMQELFRNSHHYQAIIQFKNLRYDTDLGDEAVTGDSGDFGYPAADVVKIDIVKVL